MSALAKYYDSQGWQVSGSDMSISGHNADNVPDDAERVIYSAAVKSGNPELVRARSLDILILTYPEVLGELTKKYFTLAVAGSHGKSTTTALLSLMLIKAGLDPTVIVGTKLKEFGNSNFRLGKSKYLIIEACEWNNSFHHYYPDIAIITNISAEHLDTHKNLEGVIASFNKFISNVAPDGKVIRDVQSDDKKWSLKIPGHFNQLNAEAAYQAAECLSVSRKIAQAAIKNYQGSWRRMEELQALDFLGKQGNNKYFSDYAIHPNEIKAVGSALREKYPNKKIVVIFQPHQVERTTNLFNDFIGAFSDYDVVGILPTYSVAGREFAGVKKSSEDLVREITTGGEVIYLPAFEDGLNLIKKLPKNKLIVIFMGAGDIDKDARKYFRSKLLG